MQNSTTPIIINLEKAPQETRTMANYLIREKLFHSYCLEGYKSQKEYIQASDMVIKDGGILYFFSFANTFAEYLNK